jgi:transposase-like protein
VAAQKDGRRVGRIRLRQINDASAESLETAIKEMVTPGSMIRTDEWMGYNGLKAQGYPHTVVRTKSSVGDNLLPLANRATSLLKRWLLGTHQGAVRSSHLDYYLDEFTFRFNRRTSRSRGKLFFRLVQQAMAIDPAPAKSIVGGRPQV